MWLFDFAAGDRYTHVIVQGVAFQLRSETMPELEELAAWANTPRSEDQQAFADLLLLG